MLLIVAVVNGRSLLLTLAKVTEKSEFPPARGDPVLERHHFKGSAEEA
jgi:hypothetical protein